MSADAKSFLETWHRVVADRDAGALPALLSPDVRLGSPAYWGKFEGRELVGHLIGIILLTIEDFAYHREWCEGGQLALEFSGRVGELRLQGIDLICLDDESRVAEIDVLMRPIDTLLALREVVAPKMTEYLASRSESSA